MADSRKIVGGGVVVGVITTVLGTAMTDLLRPLWNPSETAPPAQHSLPIAPPSSAQEQASPPQLPAVEQAANPPRPTNNRAKSIQDKSISINDDESND